ncbi:unnamed protein product [Nesidiocoris tenuis]|uniref:Uncharacterized protein n=1 Tax=Nesidiocoris tenuis TaxID=355587 RepID=A0A6H5GSS6_9HEMI|nr:unnamed protein product [Nesidiocoris tenuis]
MNSILFKLRIHRKIVQNKCPKCQKSEKILKATSLQGKVHSIELGLRIRETSGSSWASPNGQTKEDLAQSSSEFSQSGLQSREFLRHHSCPAPRRCRWQAKVLTSHQKSTGYFIETPTPPGNVPGITTFSFFSCSSATARSSTSSSSAIYKHSPTYSASDCSTFTYTECRTLVQITDNASVYVCACCDDPPLVM